MSSLFNLSKWAGSVETDVLDVDDIKGVKVGTSGSYLGQLAKYAPTINPASVAANTTAEQTFSVPGVKVATDTVLSINKPTATAGLGIVGYRVSADDTVAITFSNNTAAPIDPPSEVYGVVVGTFN